jgi:hypothetical protein
MAAETRHRAGRRRTVTPLQDAGCAVGRHNARRVRRPAKGPVHRPQHRHPGATARRQGAAVAPPVVARPFAGAPPDQGWGGARPEGGRPRGGLGRMAGGLCPPSGGQGEAAWRRGGRGAGRRAAGVGASSARAGPAPPCRGRASRCVWGLSRAARGTREPRSHEPYGRWSG